MTRYAILAGISQKWGFQQKSICDIYDFLKSREGGAWSDRYIAEKVWGHIAVEDFQFVRVTMANLRRKIEHDTADSRYILTETGVGYRFRA